MHELQRLVYPLLQLATLKMRQVTGHRVAQRVACAHAQARAQIAQQGARRNQHQFAALLRGHAVVQVRGQQLRKHAPVFGVRVGMGLKLGSRVAGGAVKAIGGPWSAVAPDGAEAYRNARRRWWRFVRWARTQGVELPRPRLWITGTEVA